MDTNTMQERLESLDRRWRIPDTKGMSSEELEVLVKREEIEWRLLLLWTLADIAGSLRVMNEAKKLIIPILAPPGAKRG